MIGNVIYLAQKIVATGYQLLVESIYRSGL
jgi:hypothetical protein